MACLSRRVGFARLIVILVVGDVDGMARCIGRSLFGGSIGYRLCLSGRNVRRRTTATCLSRSGGLRVIKVYGAGCICLNSMVTTSACGGEGGSLGLKGLRLRLGEKSTNEATCIANCRGWILGSNDRDGLGRDGVCNRLWDVGDSSVFV